MVLIRPLRYCSWPCVCLRLGADAGTQLLSALRINRH